MSATRNPLVDRYLSDLRAALSDLPRRQRDELVAEIEAHIGEALAPGASDAEVLTLLDRRMFGRVHGLMIPSTVSRNRAHSALNTSSTDRPAGVSA